MKKYNFDEVVDRNNSNSAKYDETLCKFNKEGLIPMWIADMDYVGADPIIEALTERVNHGVYGYTSRPEGYYKAVQDWQYRRNGWKPDTDMMSFALGVLPALASIFDTFLKEGEKVIIQTPVFNEFAPAIECWGGVVVENSLIEKNGDYTMDLDNLESLAKEGARFMILCHPHNPVGRVWTEKELIDVGRICVKYNITVISDEIYSDFMLFGNKHIPFVTLDESFRKDTITCTSASKTFNLSGIQVATVVFSNKEMQEKYEKTLYRHQAYRNNVFSVIANTVGMNECEDWFNQVIEYIEGNVKYASDFINKNIPNVKACCPQSTYLIWVDFRDLNMSQEELCTFIINDAGLALSDGLSFGNDGNGFMRLNAGCARSVLEKALNQLKEAVLKKNNRIKISCKLKSKEGNYINAVV